jgi:hypothetical protein
MIKPSPSTPAKPASHEWLKKSTLVAVFLLSLVACAGAAAAENQPSPGSAASPALSAPIPAAAPRPASLPSMRTEGARPTSSAAAGVIVQDVALPADLARLLGISQGSEVSLAATPTPECVPDYGTCTVYAPNAYCCVLCSGACGCTPAAGGLSCR